MFDRTKYALLTCALGLNGALVAAEIPSVSDPTRPLGYSQAAIKMEQLRLQAIFYGSGRKEAIVNGVAVKEGDRVHGKRIVQIRPREIVYDAAGSARVLKLRPSIFTR